MFTVTEVYSRYNIYSM